MHLSQVQFLAHAIAGHAQRLEKTATALHEGKVLPESEIATLQIDAQRIAEHSAALTQGLGENQ